MDISLINYHMTTSQQYPAATTCTASLKTRFARGFLTSLLEIMTSTSSTTYSHNTFGGDSKSNYDDGGGITKSRMSHTIKTAAYTSMARAVGPRRGWSRALLFKLRNRARLHRVSGSKKCLLASKKKKKRVLRNKNKEQVTISRPQSIRRSDMLRKLVPGAASMDICSLLEETSHYIQCLATQVKVMQSIADHFSK